MKKTKEHRSGTQQRNFFGFHRILWGIQQGGQARVGLEENGLELERLKRRLEALEEK